MCAESIISDEDLTKIGLNLTKETGNDLEGLINKKIESKLEDIKITEIKMLDTMYEIESNAIEIYLRIIKDITGTIAFVFPRKAASNLVSLLLGEEKTESNEFSKMGLSALKETCNIVAGSFINKLATVLDVNPILSVPSLVFATPKSITSLILTGVDKENQKAVLLKMNFRVELTPIECDIILLLDQEPLNALANIT